MERKENDLMLNIVANPDFSIQDFATIGFDTSNTSLLDKLTYRNNPLILLKFTDKDGKFNETLFNNFYNKAVQDYNILSSAALLENTNNEVKFSNRNIYVDESKRRKGPDFLIIEKLNPDQISTGIQKLGSVGERTKSVSEIGQQNQVLLNPVEVANGGEAKWGEAPDGNLFGYFFDTLVLATYDEDTTDQVTGEIHKKGLAKLNDNGSYYYELLDGRDIYDKQVLSKLNIITSEGSTANRFDPFDSDDILKSIGGTIMKNLFLVGSMFVPYVGPVVTGASIITQLIGLTGTLGKMLSGSENSTMSKLEGWSKSWNRLNAVSEYAQNKTWCWENFINLIGDVAGLLKEQRFIFEKIPAIVKGNFVTEAGRAKLLAKFREASEKYTLKQLTALESLFGSNTLHEISLLKGTQEARAQAALESWYKLYNELGGILSKGYMTAVTVGDTYGEAKAAGASDIDATLLTLGYAAGEYAILNTGIGEWILPELRASRYRSKAIYDAITGNIKKLTEVNFEKLGKALSTWPKEDKMKWAKNLFNQGKAIAQATYANGTSKGSRLLKASIAGGLGEGVEEVSEELLADFSKGCYNTVNWLRGEDVRLSSFGFNWHDGTREFNSLELFDRYSMSFIGGIVGGGLTNLGTSYNMMNYSYTPESAKRELVYMARQGELGEFRKMVQNMNILGDINVSATDFEQVDGLLLPKPGTPNNNLNLFAKKAVLNYLDFIENALNAEGVNLSNDEFINKALGDLRYYQLHNSITAVSLLEDFNQLNTDIVTEIGNIRTWENAKKDKNKDGVTTDRESRSDENTEGLDYDILIKNARERIKEKKKQLEDLVSGKNSAIYAGLALIEMIPWLHEGLFPISFPLYVLAKYGKNFNELSGSELVQATTEYKGWNNDNKAELIKYVTAAFMDIIQNFSSTLLALQDAFKNINEQLLNTVNQITEIYKGLQTEETINDSTTLLGRASIYDNLAKILNSETYNQAITKYNDKISSISEDESYDNRELIISEAELAFQEDVKGIVNSGIIDLANKFISQGFINSDTKRQLLPLLKEVSNKLSNDKIDYLIQLEEDGLLEDSSIISDFDTKILQIEEVIKAFNNLSNTPFITNLNQFAISIGNDPINFEKLMSVVDNMFTVNKDDLSLLDMSDTTSEEITNAIRLIQLYQAAIRASKIDSIQDIWGFSKTINEIANKSGNPLNLAEINSDFASILENDLENAKQKLMFVKALYDHNQGNKLVEQEKTATNTYRIIYNKVKSIILVLDDDDDNLKNIIEPVKNFINNPSNFPTLERVVSENKLTLSPKEKKSIQLEITSIDDAIFNLINLDYFLKNPNNLLKFFNPKRFNVYGSRFNELLNKDTKTLNDMTFLYYIISRACIKASDFMSLYKDVINPDSGIAPIIPLELAIYTAYANIMNGTKFTTLVRTFNKSVELDWTNKTIEQRKEIFKGSNYSESEIESLTSDNNVSTFLLYLPTAKYDNISLVEGIAGSGN